MKQPRMQDSKTSSELFRHLCKHSIVGAWRHPFVIYGVQFFVAWDFPSNSEPCSVRSKARSPELVASDRSVRSDA